MNANGIPSQSQCQIETGSGGHVGVTDPRSSRNRQMTLATTSSFLSKCACSTLSFLDLVRAENFSDAVAPKHRAKSIVDDFGNRMPWSKRISHWSGRGLYNLNGSYVLTPQLFLHNSVWNRPASHAIGQMCCLGGAARKVCHGLLVR